MLKEDWQLNDTVLPEHMNEIGKTVNDINKRFDSTGAANKAVELKNARKINNTSFNGTGNITTNEWGAIRNIKIGETSKPVNGSADVEWNLNEIGAAPKSHGTHVPSVCTVITDWNSATTNGWYMGNGATNAPTTGVWYFGEVIAHNDNYLLQIVYQFTASSDAKAIPKYIRARMNGTWGGWTNVTVSKAVPSNAVFTDTNTWRGIIDNLTSTSTTESLSANQGKVLKDLIDKKSDENHTHNYLPLTGGTVTGITSFLNGINGGQSWGITKDGIATFPGVNVHRDLVVSGMVSGKRGVGGVDTWSIENNGNAMFNDMRANGIIYGINNIALARGTIYLPQGGGNVVADYLRIGGGFMVSADSGNFHFLTMSGVKSNIYCGNVINTYALSSNITKATKSVFDTINAINVVDTDDGLRLSKATKDIVDSKVISTSIINEETQEEGINIDTVGAISTLWKAIQELKQENEELNKRLKLIEEKIAI